MRILAQHDGGSGCAYYRVIQPLRELERHGHQVTMLSSASPGTGIADRAAAHDVIVGQRFDNYAGLGTWRRASALARTVYEVDDDVFSIEQVNFAAWQKYSKADSQDAVAHYAETAGLVTVTTEPLAQVMRKFNPNTVVIGNHVPAWVLDLPAPAGDRPAVGWHGGASHGFDISVAAPHLRRFLDRNPGWDAVLIGADYRPAVRHRRCGFIPWTHVTDDEPGFYRSLDFDIGIAPLKPSLFNRSKSCLKALEYAARGIPVVASDLEPYRDFVVHGVTGFLVKRDHEWVRYLEELAADADLRASMGAKAKEVARGWTIDRGWKLWEDAYRSLI